MQEVIRLLTVKSHNRITHDNKNCKQLFIIYTLLCLCPDATWAPVALWLGNNVSQQMPRRSWLSSKLPLNNWSCDVRLERKDPGASAVCMILLCTVRKQQWHPNLQNFPFLRSMRMPEGWKMETCLFVPKFLIQFSFAPRWNHSMMRDSTHIILKVPSPKCPRDISMINIPNRFFFSLVMWTEPIREQLFIAHTTPGRLFLCAVIISKTTATTKYFISVSIISPALHPWAPYSQHMSRLFVSLFSYTPDPELHAASASLPFSPNCASWSIFTPEHHQMCMLLL